MDSPTHSTGQDRWRKRVFVSHATPDRATADALVAKLEEAGIMCWVAPRDVPAGAYYGGAIIEAIQTSELTVHLLSSHSNRSPHVTNEIERSVNYRKPIITVRLEDVAPAREIELHVAGKQWIDLWEIRLEALARLLLIQLGGLVKSAMPQEPTNPAAALGREADAHNEEVRRIQEQEVLRQQAAARDEQERQRQQEALSPRAAAKLEFGNPEHIKIARASVETERGAAVDGQEGRSQQVVLRQQAAAERAATATGVTHTPGSPANAEQAHRERGKEPLWFKLLGTLFGLALLVSVLAFFNGLSFWIFNDGDVFGHNPKMVMLSAGIVTFLILVVLVILAGIAHTSGATDGTSG